jgi:heptosyltransferase III
MGRRYTRDVIQLSEHVDEFLNYDEIERLKSKDEKVKTLQALSPDMIFHVFPVKAIAFLAKAASIPERVGTRSRWYHWFSCNRLINLHRKNSSLHEAQLNLSMLQTMKIFRVPEVSSITALYGFNRLPSPENISTFLKNDRYRVILHPTSKGSAREWPLQRYSELIERLDPAKYQVIITGTADDNIKLKEWLEGLPNITDTTGKLSMNDLIALIHNCNALVAASTGPLHIAAALGKKAIGVYSARRPVHPGRWAPLGPDAHALVFDKECPRCAKGEECDCIERISAAQVLALLP